MSKKITEALGAAKTTGPGRAKVTLITPGVGSSGNYSTEVLQQAAQDKAFGRGTQMHINHNTAIEDMERPEGDLRNLAGVLVEDAYWDGNGLVAEAHISSAWRDFIDEFHEFIGVSISAQAEITESGDISRFIPSPFNRADFVTVAGRGGEVTELMEAARVIESRSIIAEETTANDIEMWLDAALNDKFPGEYRFARDHDDQYVYYRGYDNDKYYRLAYELNGARVLLHGQPEQVNRRTEYDPVTQDSQPAPAGVNPSQQDQQEATMAQIDEAELKALQQRAGRADELANEVKELKEAQATQAAESRKEKALATVREAFGDDAPTFYVQAAETAATKQDYDHEAFTSMVNEAAGHQAKEAGTPNLGGTTTNTVTESKVTDDDIVAAFEGRA